MELKCTSRILNSTNPVETMSVSLSITDEDMERSSISQLERQARLAVIQDRLSYMDCELEVIQEDHLRLYFMSRDLRHLSMADKIFIADCNRLPWLKVEIVSVPDEQDHPKFYRALRNEVDVDC